MTCMFDIYTDDEYRNIVNDSLILLRHSSNTKENQRKKKQEKEREIEPSSLDTYIEWS